MSGIYAETVKSGKKCPNCGAELINGLLHIGQSVQVYSIACQCATEREKAERKELLDRGTRLAHDLLKRKAGIPKRYMTADLNTLQPRQGQEEAFKAARESEGGLMFIGGVGSGKTLISAAILNAYLDSRPISERTAERLARGIEEPYLKTGAMFVNIENLIARIKATFNAGRGDENAQDLLDSFKRAELLVIDDIGAEKATDFAKEQIYELINYRYNEELRTIITTNATPRELTERLGNRTADRIRSMCVGVVVTAESQRETAK